MFTRLKFNAYLLPVFYSFFNVVFNIQGRNNYMFYLGNVPVSNHLIVKSIFAQQ